MNRVRPTHKALSAKGRLRAHRRGFASGKPVADTGGTLPLTVIYAVIAVISELALVSAARCSHHAGASRRKIHMSRVRPVKAPIASGHLHAARREPAPGKLMAHNGGKLRADHDHTGVAALSGALTAIGLAPRHGDAKSRAAAPHPEAAHVTGSGTARQVPDRTPTLAGMTCFDDLHAGKTSVRPGLLNRAQRCSQDAASAWHLPVRGYDLNDADGSRAAVPGSRPPVHAAHGCGDHAGAVHRHKEQHTLLAQATHPRRRSRQPVVPGSSRDRHVGTTPTSAFRPCPATQSFPLRSPRGN